MTLLRIAGNERLRCPRCGGNVYLENLDGPELRCLQCSRLVATLMSDPRESRHKLPEAA